MEQITVHHENELVNGASTHLSAHMLNTTTTFLTVSHRHETNQLCDDIGMKSRQKAKTRRS